MTKNLSLEDFSKVSNIYSIIEELESQARERGYYLICSFSFGIYPANLTLILRSAILDKEVFNFVTFNLLDRSEYTKALDSITTIRSLIESDVIEEEIKRHERMIEELKTRVKKDA